jgi:hypothetical protein
MLCTRPVSVLDLVLANQVICSPRHAAAVVDFRIDRRRSRIRHRIVPRRHTKKAAAALAGQG